MSFISHRFAQASNKYMKDFKSDDEKSYLTYFDANILYNNAMCYPLPVGNFKWVKASRKEFILKCFREKRYNFLVECNTKYLKNYVIFIMIIHLLREVSN